MIIGYLLRSHYTHMNYIHLGLPPSLHQLNSRPPLIPLRPPRHRSRQRPSLPNLRPPPTHPPRHLGKNRNDPLRAPCGHSNRTRMQNVPTRGGRVQRRGHGVGLFFSHGSRKTEGRGFECCRSVEGVVWCCWGEFEGEFERAFCQVWEFGGG